MTACEPPPPRPILEVNTTVDGADASPGDGICESTPGAGDCSLSAAIEEGNALGRATIDIVPSAGSGIEVAGSLTVTGDIIITRPAEDVVNRWLDSLLDVHIDVASGGRLELDRMTGRVSLSVAGTVVGRQLFVYTWVTVQPGGVAGFDNSILANWVGDPVVHNSGTVVLNHTTLDTWNGAGAALENAGTAYTVATIVGSCGGSAPVSLGYTADTDGSCALTGPTDQPLAPTPDYGRRFNLYPHLYWLAPDSPLVDAIPVGVHGCGTMTEDMMYIVRPTDGDEDGTSGCDIGAIERSDYSYD